MLPLQIIIGYRQAGDPCLLVGLGKIFLWVIEKMAYLCRPEFWQRQELLSESSAFYMEVHLQGSLEMRETGITVRHITAIQLYC